MSHTDLQIHITHTGYHNIYCSLAILHVIKHYLACPHGIQHYLACPHHIQHYLACVSSVVCVIQIIWQRTELSL